MVHHTPVRAQPVNNRKSTLTVSEYLCQPTTINDPVLISEAVLDGTRQVVPRWPLLTQGLRSPQIVPRQVASDVNNRLGTEDLPRAITRVDGTWIEVDVIYPG